MAGEVFDDQGYEKSDSIMASSQLREFLILRAE
jgi:hypothetical protein